ncbi:MAG: methyltransferase [Rhizobacter sp.]|nr:methyltransferase [Rhizobacter sp.]
MAASMALAACGSMRMPFTSSPAPTPAAPTALSATDRIAQIVASPTRSAADKAADVRRKPQPMLAFIGVRPGMTVLDISSGGGYTTELLARVVGPQGLVYGQSQPRDPNRAMPAPAAPEGGGPAPSASAPMPGATPSQAVPNSANAAMPVAVPGSDMSPPMPSAPIRLPTRTAATALAERQAAMKAANVPAAPIIAVEQRFDNPVPAAAAAEKLDVVTLMLNYHDFGFMGVDRAAMNRAVFAALKHGGVYVISDHAGRPGTGISESGTLHRIEEQFLIAEVEAAGFQLKSEAAFLRNANDPRDQNTPNPPMPKDDFIVKFVKP